MKQIISYFIALQIALAPSLTLAQNQHSSVDSSSVATAVLNPDSPFIITDSQNIELPSGDIYTTETSVVVAETEKEKNLAEQWFLLQTTAAEKQGSEIRVIGLTTEGTPEALAAHKLQEKLSADLKHSTDTIKKPLLERIKTAANAATSYLKKPLSRWVDKNPEQFKMVFAVARAGINGAFSSYIFNYFFLDGSIPTWLAWTTGLTLGAISGTINYFSGYYSHWLDKKADVKTHDLLLKFFPFLTSEQINELKSMSKWGTLQSVFLAIPILFFQYLPTLLDSGSGFDFASSWLTGLFAFAMSLATGMFAQYPWEKGISRAHTVDSSQAKDLLSKNWIEFKTALMFVLISGLQVAATSLSLGDYKVSSYLVLGAIGFAGILYRRKVIQRTDAKKSCADYISYNLLETDPKPLSWVS